MQMEFIPAVISLKNITEFVSRRADGLRDWAYALQQLGEALQALPGTTVHGVAPDYSGYYVCFYVSERSSSEALRSLAIAMDESRCPAEACRLVHRSQGFPRVAGSFRFVLLTGPAKALALAGALGREIVPSGEVVPDLISA